MAKFNVWIYYHGCYSTEVDAETKDEALEKARYQAYDMSEDEFLKAIEVMENGSDVEPCKD